MGSDNAIMYKNQEVKKWYLQDFINRSFLAKEMGMSASLFDKKAKQLTLTNPRTRTYRFTVDEEKKLDMLRKKIADLLS